MSSMQDKIKNYILYILTLAIVIVWFFPIFWIFLTSFKIRADYLEIPPTWIPFIDFKPVLDNYFMVFFQTITGFSATGGKFELVVGVSSFPFFFQNSIIITVGATILSTVIGIFAAYAFSRFEFTGSNTLQFVVLAQRMLPAIAVVIPIFLFYTWVRLFDTHLGLILLYTLFNLPWSVWMLKSFFDEIPRDYEEAAMVDGYSRMRAFFKYIIPQSITGIAATAAFCSFWVWNEFSFALILTSQKARTAPPFITSATAAIIGVDWGQVAAGATVFLIPMFIFTILIRKYLLRGLTFGTIRGG